MILGSSASFMKDNVETSVLSLHFLIFSYFAAKKQPTKKKEGKSESKPKDAKKAFEVIEPFPQVKKGAPKKEKTDTTGKTEFILHLDA